MKRFFAILLVAVFLCVNCSVVALADEPIIYCTLTINYLYEDGSAASPPYVWTAPFGTSFNFQSPYIMGYRAEFPFLHGKLLGDSNYDVFYYSDEPTPTPTPEPTKPPDYINYDLVGFSSDSLYEMATTIRSNIGSITNIAFYLFVLIVGIFLIRKLIDYFSS